MSEADVANMVLEYRLTGKCSDKKLAKLCDGMFGESRFAVAKAYSGGKKKAPAKKKAAKKK